MGPGMFRGLDELLRIMAWLSVIGIISGIYWIWKFIWWCIEHVSIN